MTSTLIEWREDFSLGVPEVDHEHRELVALINALYAELIGNAGHGRAGEFLAELHAQISAHFALEERLMRESDYSDYGPHKTDHEALLDDIVDLMDEFDSRTDVDLTAFAERLEQWFTQHFRTHDARLHLAGY